MKVELPYEIGTFVEVSDSIGADKRTVGKGTVSAYTVCGPDDILIWVSGYKESWCGEYLPSEIRVLSEDEVEKLHKEKGLPLVPKNDE